MEWIWMGELSLLIKLSLIRVVQAEIMMVTVVETVDMIVIAVVPLVGEVVEIALNVASLDILQESVLLKVVEMVVEGSAQRMIGTVRRTIGMVQKMIGMVQRRIGMVQRMIGTAPRMIGMVVGMVEVVAMDLIAVVNALEDAAGMVAAVELQEVRGTVVLHMTAPELVVSTRILLQRLKKLKVSAFSSCQVKVTLDGLFSSMYLDSSRKKMCSLFWP